MMPSNWHSKNTEVCGRLVLPLRRAALLGIGPLVSLRLRKVVPLPEVLITFPPYRLRSYDTMVVGDTGLRDVGVPLDGQIIATPGHAADSVSLLFDDGVCLLGDAAENEFAFQRLGADYRTHLITNVEALYASWEKLITAGARRMYPAHGCPFAVDRLKENLWKHTAENLVPVPPWVYRLS